MLKVTLELMDDPRHIQKVVDGLLVEELNSIVSNVSADARDKIIGLVEETIKQSSEIQTLRKSEIRGELGLKASVVNNAINDIAASISESTKIVVKKFRKSGTKITGGITVNIQPAELRNILSLSSGKLNYKSSTYKTSVELGWLEWLLTRGDSIIVGKFEFAVEPGRGRSGQGRMKKAVGWWRVPPSISGTIEDNFITRAFDDKVKTRINSILERSMKKFWG